MSKFFENLLKEHKTNAPKSVEDALYKQFRNAVSIDWFLKDGGYEAIFYEDQIEHIAQFNQAGELMLYKVNLPLQHLPSLIRQQAEKKGKVMNAVEFHPEKEKKYEIIIQREDSKRFQLLMNNEGEILGEKEL